ncbi:MAG: ABC transporter permease [Rikenellaceae bacterium]
MKQFFAFVKKEFYHIFRDPRTILILLAMPIVQIILFGFAISTEVKNARVAILDPSPQIESRRIIDKIDASEYFTLKYVIHRPSEVDDLFRSGHIDMALIFDSEFSRHRNVQIITDASDPNTATIVANYATAIIKSIDTSAPVVRENVSFLYNPSMLSSYNFVPGVMGMILMLICAMMTSISIVREKEMGTMEVLLVSPMHPIKMIIAKIVPYFAVSIINLTVILILSVHLLNVPIAGGFTGLILLSLLFIFVALSLGLLVSTLVEKQVSAMIISGMIFMMPTVLLSGMMFPIENMPLPLQYFSSIIPARWFIAGVRKLMIQGVEIQYAAKEFAILGLMAIVFITLSLKKFKIRL